MFCIFSLLLALVPAPALVQAQRPAPTEVIRVWPLHAPGTESWSGPEVELHAQLPAGRVHIITNVTVPTITVVRPQAGSANGTAVLVLPGGAFRALAWDLEGMEAAQWLARRGITAFVLRYRVRPPTDAPPGPEAFDAWLQRTQPARSVAVADARRALRLIRTRAADYRLSSGRVGMLGFSAGAITMMELALASDAADRPDFVASIYGAAPVEGEPAADAPPLFIVAAQDDPQVPPTRSVEMHRRWVRAGVPVELHLYERGGHGFGLRARNLPADDWPEALEAWLLSRGLATAAGAAPPR